MVDFRKRFFRSSFMPRWRFASPHSVNEQITEWLALANADHSRSRWVRQIDPINLDRAMLGSNPEHAVHADLLGRQFQSLRHHHAQSTVVFVETSNLASYGRLFGADTGRGPPPAGIRTRSAWRGESQRPGCPATKLLKTSTSTTSPQPTGTGPLTVARTDSSRKQRTPSSSVRPAPARFTSPPQ